MSNHSVPGDLSVVEGCPLLGVSVLGDSTVSYYIISILIVCLKTLIMLADLVISYNSIIRYKSFLGLSTAGVFSLDRS